MRIGGCALALALLTACMAVAQDADLILYFDYEAIDGSTVVNKAGNGLDGAVNGQIDIVDGGKLGMAAQFAAGSYIDLDGPSWAADVTPREGMSVLAWVNVDSLGGDHAIFNARAADETWLIHPEVRGGDGNFRWLLRTDGGTTIFDIRAGAAAAGEWVHFAGVYDSASGAALYINGEQVGDGPGGSSIAEGWGLGARVGMNVDDARPFTGLMDDLSIWKRGLTADEVAAIMDAGAIPAGAAVDA
ncbi:LamG domain-containing protein, partial [Candidatus Poribacteria bacterium]|nr:LamG domain-containing protein [Candidatus Poribacteria bacterium]